ncbi:M14 family metallopeptidase [Cupriavidus pauculus]|uniref:M14 family metallopeptidase n=1 Tax=Cupriavidus pauculus TaxID=82633 RepID=UPI00078609E0|nr:M14 family metallopeptidase [Cupriavidus pauculus]MBY4728990.1 M14 family metallopeptidase [Cupriavidus pauculus]
MAASPKVRSARYFARSYAEARQKFLDAAHACGASLTEFPHPTETGRDGETLAMDVAWLGDAQAQRVVLVTSGTHGAEGFCGSGAQVAMLDDTALHADCRRAGVALMLVHAVNPYGFSHLRRVNEDNVDLNRNFMDFDRPLPLNPAYAEVAPLLLPSQWPPSCDEHTALMTAVARKGMPWYQAAVSAGQYQDPHGMFFGGQKATWSNYTLRRVLARFGAGRSALRWIDVHTGLGPWGYGEPIYMGPDDDAHLARARTIWGTSVTSIYDGSSTSANLTGLAWLAVPQTLPSIDYAGIALEFGTLPLSEVLDALRGDHWLHVHPEADENQRSLIKDAVWRAFYGDADDWREGVVTQVTDAVRKALTS